MLVYPNLDRLNASIRAANLGIPEFRSHVDSSGRNLKWLKKVIHDHPSAGPELRALIEMPHIELLRGSAEH